MIWSELSSAAQYEIITKYTGGTSTELLALEYGLRVSSLERKMRLLTQKVTPLLGVKESNLVVEKPTRFMAYSDTHFGAEDETALSAALIVANWWSPEILINVGDTLDCYQASTFKKDIGHASIQRERDLWADWAEKMNVASGAQKKKIVRGNHDMRFASLVLSIGSIADINELSLDSLLYLAELGYDPIVDVINVNPSGDALYPDAQMYVFHGEKASSFAGGAARAASDMYAGASVIVGHNHKTGVFTERSGRGVTTSYEIGTLAKLNPEYHLRANWSQSVLTGYIAPGYHDVRVHMIDRGVVVLDGKAYKS